MTEKRFTITGDRGISDHQKKRLYDLNDFDGMISVTETLNELHDENVELQGRYDAQKELYCQLNSDKNNIWQDYQDLKKENEQLKEKVEELYENDRILRKQLIQEGILVKTDYFREVLGLLEELGYDDLYNDLNTTSLDMGIQGCGK